ncbi:MAG TPA: penicillin-binding protein 2 [Candidatus Saccharimonadales bacterium]|nr:penicillin-binding protein 2 [Candidatus Saccharimonadales bacterium]
MISKNKKQSSPSRKSQHGPRFNSITRGRLVFAVITLTMGVFIIRLFYIEVIRHNYYQQAAYSDQLKEYQIPDSRGMIEASNGNQIVPLVLNQTLYTLFADPAFIKDPGSDAAAVARIIGGSTSNYASLMSVEDSQYEVLANKLSTNQSNQINNLNLVGIGTRPVQYRTYPDGTLASQLLGFVNNAGKGQYGIEQALNSTLSGTPGQVKAITDAQGIPLVGNKNNVQTPPVNGKNVVLTINLSIQQQLETLLQAGLKKVNSPSGSAVVMDPNTGNIVAMANYPTYDPTNYESQTDSSVFQNAAVDSPLEPGSIMKTLTVSAGLDLGAITSPAETFDDPGSYSIDGSTISDIAQDSGVDKGTISVTSILVNSLNTGATWMLMQMGGGQINQQARTNWYNYMVNHYHLGSATGIQQGYEAAGYVPSPNIGPALDLTYANTAFGQAVTLTPLQMAAAVSAILNGGTYYNPNLVQSIQNPNTGKTTTQSPTIWKKNIVKPAVGAELAQIMESVVNTNYYIYQMPKPAAGYIIGGKTGTAQIAQPGGGYSSTNFNGTFIGFVGVNKPQYVIMVEVNTPHIPENSIDTYAGAGAAAPIFGKIANMLISNGNVTN